MTVMMAGVFGPLAERTYRLLEAAGHPSARRLVFPDRPPADLPVPDTLLLFPFSPPTRRNDFALWRRQLAWLQDLVRWASGGGVRRIVLRSSVTAYGSSFKNYGLMEEDRTSLLGEQSPERRWVEAEELVLGLEGQAVAWSAAALRLAHVAHPEEGSLPAAMFAGRWACPAAGYDPRLQFISLDDAAAALVCAAQETGSGLYNITADGCVEFRRSLRRVTPLRLPVGQSLQRPARALLKRIGLVRFGGEAVDQLQYNVTVTAQRARRELGFQPRATSVEALREMLRSRGKSGGERISTEVDDFGLDPQYLQTWSPWFNFLRKVYWRVEAEGLEHLPRSGPALLVANHRGFMPFDGVIHRSLILERTGRHIRFLVIPSLFKFAFLSDFLIKQGGVVASQLNTARLFSRGEFVGIFPEGISGAFRMYKGAYQLGAFGRDAFAKMAIEHQVPVIPGVVVGHVEIFPILGKMYISPLVRWTGWPFIPITPTFPLLPVPLPTKWHIRYLEPVSVSPLRPEDAEDRRKVREFSQHVREIMQRNIDEMLVRRKHIFFGRIFDSPGRVAATRTAAQD
jgi:1-acyl-sn-glycerol-3-phosphate acyltransferase/nucleoside-diphosphate-sugar epimerase